MSPELRQRIIRSLYWLVADAKWRFDDTRQNLESGSEGGYGPELCEAMDLLDNLRRGEE